MDESTAIAKMEAFDDWSDARGFLHHVASVKQEYAGIPMPISGEQLVVEKGYPFAAYLNAKPDTVDDDELEGWKLRNRFWSGRYRCWILVMEKDGKIDWGIVPAANHLKQDLHTMGCSVAWGIVQEHRALELLATLLPHHKFKQYLLAGIFLETSKRSGVTYIFRKLRPTVAITTKGDKMKLLCTLCMHPIAHYAESWAGAMCPTDDIIAHLMMMRADEAMYWRRSNQCPGYLPEAGL